MNRREAKAIIIGTLALAIIMFVAGSQHPMDLCKEHPKSEECK